MCLLIIVRFLDYGGIEYIIKLKITIKLMTTTSILQVLFAD